MDTPKVSHAEIITHQMTMRASIQDPPSTIDNKTLMGLYMNLMDMLNRHYNGEAPLEPDEVEAYEKLAHGYGVELFARLKVGVMHMHGRPTT